ncbi:hypothetical protein [Serratia ficaria]|nr:hypothetical protein [Serratia ficaria]
MAVTDQYEIFLRFGNLQALFLIVGAIAAGFAINKALAQAILVIVLI